MSTFNRDTTWVGVLGGGVSGSVLGGGSVFQIDLWHMGGNPLPVRVLVTGKRAGIVAEVGTGMCALIVTGVRDAKDMDGITSSGLDWELSVGLKGSAIAKTGASLFRTMVAEATAAAGNWAMHESAKRFVQWTMNDLGVVQTGRQFNLIPSPLSVSVGAGIFYEWQKLRLLEGDVGWSYISPKWSVENVNGDVYFQLLEIPEQDDARIRLGFYVPEWGLDPLIRWEGNSRGRDYYFTGYVYHRALFDGRRKMGFSGYNLSKLKPIGRLEQGFLSNDHTKDVVRNGKLTVRPVVFGIANMERWCASQTMEVETDGEGRFRRVKGTSNLRD